MNGQEVGRETPSAAIVNRSPWRIIRIRNYAPERPGGPECSPGIWQQKPKVLINMDGNGFRLPRFFCVCIPNSLPWLAGAAALLLSLAQEICVAELTERGGGAIGNAVAEC